MVNARNFIVVKSNLKRLKALYNPAQSQPLIQIIHVHPLFFMGQNQRKLQEIGLYQQMEL